jgi:Rrf2 family transcriptional regulator, iron-sulfur cluster assembly transcription factor
MLLTKKTHYALIAMVDLCQNSGDPVKVVDIAKRQNLPKDFLNQIFMSLKNAGVVVVQRGPGGGYKLANTPEATKVADIISAIGDYEVTAGAIGDSPEAVRVNEYIKILNENVWNYFSHSLKDLAEGNYE